MSSKKIEFVEIGPHDCSVKDEADLRNLLSICFQGAHEGRSFFKQVPSVRIVAKSEKGIIGHVGLEYRSIRINDNLFSIVGLIDVCVLPDDRNTGIASKLVRLAEIRSKNQQFSILMADDHRLYSKLNYFFAPEASVTWYCIEDLKSHSIINRNLSNIMMIKPLSGLA